MSSDTTAGFGIARLCLLRCPFAFPASPPEAEPSPKPNVIWVFGDQHRAQALSFMHGRPQCADSEHRQHGSGWRHLQQRPRGISVKLTVSRIADQRSYPHKWHLSGWHEADGRAAFHISSTIACLDTSPMCCPFRRSACSRRSMIGAGASQVFTVLSSTIPLSPRGSMTGLFRTAVFANRRGRVWNLSPPSTLR